jgi:NAD(P)H-hydrate epimerase
VKRDLPVQPQTATIVVDAVLGTGLSGAAKGTALNAIRSINEFFPVAKKIAVDIPSGLPSDETNPIGEFVKTDFTVTFTAVKPSQCLSPIYQHCGKLRVFPIGSTPSLYGSKPLRLTTPDDLRHLFAKRLCDSNKGMYGHVFVVGGSFGKSGAPIMAALGSYRSGAGLVTAAVPKEILTAVAAYRPELMTEPLEESDFKRATVLAIGPGLGTSDETVPFVKRLYVESPLPAVVDADALNALAGDLPHTDKIRILTPHPGEMSRLMGITTKQVQADRLGNSQAFAKKSGAAIVLKGDRTVIAFPDGETWVNPTGSPAMATGGTGDILTGLTAGLVAQHPNDWKRAVCAAVWLHGRCGELAAQTLGEESMLALDLLTYLPEAMHELRP